MVTFIYTYAYWHYTHGVQALLLHAGNFMIFLWRFFGIPMLLMTLLSPWRRMQEPYEDGFDIQAKLAAFSVNTIMRGVGVFVRLVMITFGVLSLLALLLLLLTVFLLWLTLPAVLGVLLVLFLDTLL